jgi:hypothetical protein
MRPVLVYGFDMTKDFAMVTYSNEGVSVQTDVTLDIPMFGSASASFWTAQSTIRTPHTNHGPQECNPPPPGGILLLESGTAECPYTEFNQCVFIRYYTMRFGVFVIRAGAGPHDLGSGENEGDTFPELTARVGAEPATSDDEASEGQSGSTVDDVDSELDMVVHNAPFVRPFVSPFLFTLIFSSRMRNAEAGMSSQTTCFR